MQRYIMSLLILCLLTLPILAQEETVVCQTPFTIPSSADDTTIMTVNDTQISASEFEARIRFEHAYNAIKLEIQVALHNATSEATGVSVDDLIASDPVIQQISTEDNNPDQLGNRVLGEMLADVVTWEYAQQNDLVILDNMFNTTLQDFFAFSDETSDEQQAIIDNFSQRILLNGTPAQQLTTFFCRQSVYDAVQSQVIPPAETTIYIDADHILVSSQEVAQDIITLLEAGEDFATLADQLSLDITSGGALGSQPISFLPPSFADAALVGDINSILDIVQTRFGWHVIRLNDRVERPVPENQRATIESIQFDRWRSDQINDASISVNPDWQLFLPDL